jgi:parallel beta-helix repeat protein
MLTKRKWAALLIAILMLASCTTLFIVFSPYKAPIPAGAIIVPDNYKTIQAAINGCRAGATIYVRSGVYNEILTIDKQVTLIGENNQTTIINGHTQYMWTISTIAVKANYVTISNFMINGSNYGIGTGSSNITITQNIISNYFQAGISVGGENQIISHNSLIGTNGGEIGIQIASSDSLISENRVVNNTYEGIEVDDQSRNIVLRGNIITDNGKNKIEYASGIILRLSESCVVFNNTISDNGGAGIMFEGCENTIVHDNYIAHNNAGLYALNYVYADSVAKNITVYKNSIIDNDQQAVVSKDWLGIGKPQDLDPKNQNGTDIITWDNGTIGNYWSDCQERYPDATQNSNTGTYNTPYTIDANNKDSHPLISRSVAG